MTLDPINYTRRIIAVSVAVMAQSPVEKYMRIVWRARVDAKPSKIPLPVSYETSRACDDLKMHGNEDNEGAKERGLHSLAIVTEQAVMTGVRKQDDRACSVILVQLARSEHSHLLALRVVRPSPIWLHLSCKKLMTTGVSKQIISPKHGDG